MVKNSQEPNQIDQKVHLGLILGYECIRKTKNYQFGHYPKYGPIWQIWYNSEWLFDQDTIPSHVIVQVYCCVFPCFHKEVVSKNVCKSPIETPNISVSGLCEGDTVYIPLLDHLEWTDLIWKHIRISKWYTIHKDPTKFII